MNLVYFGLLLILNLHMEHAIDIGEVRARLARFDQNPWKKRGFIENSSYRWEKALKFTPGIRISGRF